MMFKNGWYPHNVNKAVLLISHQKEFQYEVNVALSDAVSIIPNVACDSKSK